MRQIETRSEVKDLYDYRHLTTVVKNSLSLLVMNVGDGRHSRRCCTEGEALNYVHLWWGKITIHFLLTHP